MKQQLFERVPSQTLAIQFDGDIPVKDLEDAGVCFCDSTGPHVHTAHSRQKVYLSTGDWVLPEPDGDGYYPVKDHFFKKTYRPIEAAAPYYGPQTYSEERAIAQNDGVDVTKQPYSRDNPDFNESVPEEAPVDPNREPPDAFIGSEAEDAPPDALGAVE